MFAMIEGNMQEETFVSIADRWKACQDNAAKKSNNFTTLSEPVVVAQMTTSTSSTSTRKWKPKQDGDLGEIRLQPPQVPNPPFVSTTASNVLILKPSLDSLCQPKVKKNENKFELKRLSHSSDSASITSALSAGRGKGDMAKSDCFSAGGLNKSATSDIVMNHVTARKDNNIAGWKKERYSLPEDSRRHQQAPSAAIQRNGRSSLSSMPSIKSVDEPTTQCKRESFNSDTQTDFARPVRKLDSVVKEAISKEPGSRVTRTFPHQEVGGVRQSIPCQSVPSMEYSLRKPQPLFLPLGDDASTRSSSFSISAVVSNLEKAAKEAESRKLVVPVSFLPTALKKVSPKNETKWMQSKPVDSNTSSDGTKHLFGSAYLLKPVIQVSDEERGSDIDKSKKKIETSSNLQNVLFSLKKVDLPQEEKWKKKMTNTDDETSTDQRPIYSIPKKLNPLQSKSTSDRSEASNSQQPIYGIAKQIDHAQSKSTTIPEFERKLISQRSEFSIDQRSVYAIAKELDQAQSKSTEVPEFPRTLISDRSEVSTDQLPIYLITKHMDQAQSKSITMPEFPRNQKSEQPEAFINQQPKKVDQSETKSTPAPEYPRTGVSGSPSPRDIWTANQKRSNIVVPTVNKMTNKAIVAPLKSFQRVHSKEQTHLSPQSKDEGGQVNPPSPFTFRQSSTSKELEALRSLGLQKAKAETVEPTDNKLTKSITVSAIKNSTSVQPKEPSQLSPQSKQEEGQEDSNFSFRQSSMSKELEALRSLGLTKKVTLTKSVTTAPSSSRDDTSQIDELCVKELAKTFAAKATMPAITMNRTPWESKNFLSTKQESTNHTARTSMSNSPKGTRKFTTAGESDRVLGSLKVSSEKLQSSTGPISDKGASSTLDLLATEAVSNKKISAQEELSFIRSLGLAKTLSLNATNRPTYQKTTFSSTSRTRSFYVPNEGRSPVGQPREPITVSANQPRASSVGRTRTLAQETFFQPSWTTKFGNDAHSVTSLPTDFDCLQSVGSLRPSCSTRLDRHSPSNHTSRSLDNVLNDDLQPAMSMNSEYTTESEFDVASENFGRDNRYIQISLSSGGVAEKYEPNIVVSPTTESTDDSEGRLSESPAASSVDGYEMRNSRRRKNREPFKGAKRFFFGKKKRSVD